MNDTELYRKYRPTSFKQVVGQDDAVKVLQGFLGNGGLPHALMLTGPSGCGKTTIVRILKTHLDCGDTDFYEINAADTRGIDTVRDIRNRMTLASVGGSSRIWLIDEAHKLSSDAQTCILKMLEDTPSHVYFMLATTDPGKLLKTIHTRCTEVKLGLLTSSQVEKVILRVCKLERKELSEEVVSRIVEVAEGSARKALVILGQVIHLGSEEEQLDAVQKSDSRAQALDLCRLLLNPRSKWAEAAAILKELEDDPESVRRMILGYMTTVLLSGGKFAPRANLVIGRMEDAFYNSGKAGLVSACYDLIHTKG